MNKYTILTASLLLASGSAVAQINANINAGVAADSDVADTAKTEAENAASDVEANAEAGLDAAGNADEGDKEAGSATNQEAEEDLDSVNDSDKRIDGDVEAGASVDGSVDADDDEAE